MNLFVIINLTVILSGLWLISEHFEDAKKYNYIIAILAIGLALAGNFTMKEVSNSAMERFLSKL